MGIASALIIALTPGCAQAPAPQSAPAAGLLKGGEWTSRVAYAADRKTALELRYSVAGTPHQRLWLGEKGASARLMRFWSGTRGFGVDISSGKSAELQGAERLELGTQLELRRALVECERIAWQGTGAERRANPGLSQEKEPLGTLVARGWNESTRRPGSIVFLAPDGKALDSFRNIEWNERGPRSCEFWHGETHVWSESEFRFEARTFTPDYFAPADRRDTPGVREQSAVITTQVPEHALRRVELKPGTSMSEARKQLEELRAQAEQAGLKLENKATLELDETLRPVAVLLRLEKLPESLPAGYTKRAATTALAVQVAGFEALDSRSLAPLLERLPKGEKAHPYLRWLLVPGGEKQLLLLVSAP